MKAVLLERDGLIAQLVDLLDGAAAGKGSLALISGEAGVGKTTLVNALVDSVSKRTLVLAGACDPLSTARPLSPLLDIAADPDSGLEDIASIHEQHEVFATFLARLRNTVRPVLVVIEDIHWADDATVDLLRFLGRRVTDTKALVVVTYRQHEVGLNRLLQLLIGDLAVAGSALRLEVPPLSTAAVKSLAAGRGLDAEHLHRITGGNAFFVTEVLASGQIVPTSVRDAVMARVLRLSEKAQHVVEAVAIAPRALEVDHSLRLASAIPADADEAVSRGVLVADNGQLRFRHELARTAVESVIPPARQEALQRGMIEILVELGVDDPARLAHHASRAGDRDLVAQYAPAAANDAAFRGAHREAISFYEAALACDDLLADPARVRLRLAEQLYVLDRQDEALNQARMALEIYRDRSDMYGTGQALTTVAGYQWTSGNTGASRPILEEAIALLEPLGPSTELAGALYSSSHHHMLSRRHLPAMEHGRRSLEMAEGLNSSQNIVRAITALGTTELVTGDPDRGFELLERARQLSEGAGNKRALTVVLGMIGSGGGEVRRYREALAALREVISIGKAWDEDYLVSYSTSWLARVRFEQGRWKEATDLSSEVDSDASGTAPISWITASTARGRVGVRQGQPIGIRVLEEVSDRASRAELQHRWPAIAGVAEYRWLIGAHDRIEELVSAPYREALATDSSWARGELGFWMWRVGLIDASPANAALPYALQMNGDWREAADIWREIGCPYEVAMALADGNESALLESLEILDDLEAGPLASLVRKRLRERGAEHIPRGPRPATKADKAGLTPRQREVLSLMGEGLTNAEIADRLYLTKKTVEHHVSAILNKVGADTRAKAIAAVKDGGTGQPI